jgi:hypothetical protein
VKRAAVIALALGLGACAPLDAGSSAPAGGVGAERTRGAPTQRAVVTQAERRHEYPAQRAPARERARDTSADPAAAVRAFATAYINWTAATVTAQLRVLAALSIGQARAAMTLAASQTAGDYELRRGGVANHGTVEAVAPLTGSADRYAVVTRELTTATATGAYRGLRPAWHVALATVTRVDGGGWALSGWQPEN